MQIKEMMKRRKSNKNELTTRSPKKKSPSELFRNDYFFEDKNPEMIVIASDTKPGPYGCNPSERPIEEYIQKGVVIINKPSGPTSHETAAYVKKILNVRTAGHSGSLDPVVTGVQPVMIDKATRAVGAIRLSGKEYICLLKLHRPVPKQLIQKTLYEFTGVVYQMPPVTSAVKRKLRKRKIYYIEPLEMAGTDVLIRVGCEAGTYIRKLCHDIGMALGTGAHMQELIRSKAGPFDETYMVSLQQLADAYYYLKEENDERQIRRIVLPMETAFSHLPKIIVKDSAVGALANGASLARPGIISLSSNIEKGEPVAVFSQKKEIISLSRAHMNTSDIIEKKSGFVASPLSVFMEENIYPKIWKKKKTKEP